MKFLTLLKFMYSEKATKFCEIFPLLLTVCTALRSKAFSEYMNFTIDPNNLWQKQLKFSDS